MTNLLRLCFSAALLCLCCYAAALGQGSAFTYQGRLTDGGTPANGNYDLQFALWDSLVNGGQVGSTQTVNTVVVSNGVFTVTLEFGAQAFNGASRFLGIAARPTGGGSFTLLTPRQQISSTPYAVRSLSAASADSVPASGVPSGSGNYIQNSSTRQASSNFNISGNGTASGTLSGNIVDATTQFSLGDIRILSAPADNLFVGNGAGFSNTGGTGNAFFGYRAGNKNSNGTGNSIFGALAGTALQTGRYNSIFGYGAASRAIVGDFNSFFGNRAGEGNAGSANSFFGTAAGLQTFSGNSNTFIGHVAGISNELGSFNTVIGANADLVNGVLNNATAIGANALVSQSNSLVLGSISGINGATADTFVGIGTSSPVGNFHLNAQSSPNPIRALTLDVQSFQTPNNAVASYFFKVHDVFGGPSAFLIRGDGNIGIGTDTPNDRLEVNGIIRVSTLGSAGSSQLCRNGSSQIAQCSSSLRYKTNINPFASGLNLVSRLSPISFNWKGGGTRDLGLGAEAVEKVEPLLVTYNSTGEVEGVKYDRVAVVLINAIKEQQTQIEEQRNQIIALRTANATLSGRLRTIEKRMRRNDGPSRGRR